MAAVRRCDQTIGAVLGFQKAGAATSTVGPHFQYVVGRWVEVTIPKAEVVAVWGPLLFQIVQHLRQRKQRLLGRSHGQPIHRGKLPWLQ